MFSQHHLLLALSEKEKVTWPLLVASPISHEMILVYGSEHFSKHLPAGPVPGSGEGRRMQHRLASSGCETDCEQHDSLKAAASASEGVRAAASRRLLPGMAGSSWRVLRTTSSSASPC